MIQSDPAHRPSAADLLALPIVCSAAQKSKVLHYQLVVVHVLVSMQAQLCKELNEEKFKNEILTR